MMQTSAKPPCPVTTLQRRHLDGSALVVRFDGLMNEVLED